MLSSSEIAILTKSPTCRAIVGALADGEWHPLWKIKILAANSISPEKAIRYLSRARMPKGKTYGEAVRMGRFKKVTQIARELEINPKRQRRFPDLIERRIANVDGKRVVEYRIIPEVFQRVIESRE